MDPFDILGSILGHKTSRRGKGTDVLNDMYKRKPRTSTPSSLSPPKQDDIERAARELEDMLNVANDRHTQRRAGSTPPTTAPPVSHGQSPASTSDNDRALILVRAMVNAAKADGQIDQSEQQNILQRLGDSSREAVQFLRNEFAKPLDVHDFASSVPLGMEQQVYTLSLITIDLDTGKEANYLLELSKALRISPEVREQIHQRYGAPSVY
jgi:uncharacterized membrane protein YebE (DUF533 family)